jgi:hypothetical protein
MRAAFLVFNMVLAYLVVVSTGGTMTGVYDLRVHVKSAAGHPIREVCCGAFDERERAEAVAKNREMPFRPWSIPTIAAPFEGEPLAVNVKYTNSGYCLDLTRFDWHQRILAVVVEYEDGKCVGQVVTIPRRSFSRRIEVEIP